MALAVFLVTYVFLAGFRVPLLRLDRPGGALVGATAMVLLGVVPPHDVPGAVDFDTLVLLLGMMLLAAYLTRAGFFRATAYYVLRATRRRRAACCSSLVLVSGLLSAFLVNDTVCLMLTPLVLVLVKSADLPPAPYLLGLCMASNAGSVATFTGNPQNMIIGVASQHALRAVRSAYMALPALLSTLAVLGVLLFDLPRRTAPPLDSPRRAAAPRRSAAAGDLQRRWCCGHGGRLLRRPAAVLERAGGRRGGGGLPA